jgi:hypothetical protein
METIEFIFIIGCLATSTIAFGAGFVWRGAKISRYEYLWAKGWKYEKYNCWGDDFRKFTASDEERGRDLKSAVERQNALDRIENLNLPEAKAQAAYESGSWK